MLLNGKTAIVTGGSQGIGAITSVELAKEGANICLTYKSHKNEAETLKKQISNMGVRAICTYCDISTFTEVNNVVQKALKTFGKIDILVNNAGMNWDGVCWKMSESQWDRVIEVNLKGYFNFTRHVAPIFKEQCYGKIINVSSINGLRGKFGQSNYSASKAGIIGFTKAIAKELGSFNINVNAVAPGLIETAMLINSEQRKKITDMAINEMALNQIGKPEDLANIIVFLASDKAKHITGEIIKVDGGQYI